MRRKLNLTPCPPLPAGARVGLKDPDSAAALLRFALGKYPGSSELRELAKG